MINKSITYPVLLIFSLVAGWSVAAEEEEEKWWVEKGMVDHPPHYNKGIETSEYIRSWEMNWDQANVIKYVTRYNLKHSQPELQCQDLRKARHYLDRLIESYEEKKD